MILLPDLDTGVDLSRVHFKLEYNSKSMWNNDVGIVGNHYSAYHVEELRKTGKKNRYHSIELPDWFVTGTITNYFV